MTTPGPATAQRILLGLTGLSIDGGIACVSRCVVQALDEELAADRLERADRVLLLEDPARTHPPPLRGAQYLSRGSRLRYTWQLWRAYRRLRPQLCFFDLLGLARPTALPLPGFPPPRRAIFLHGTELAPVFQGQRPGILEGAWRLLCNSEYTAKSVARELPSVEDRLRVVQLCVEPARVAAFEAAAAATPPRQPAALIVGRLWAEERGKGHDALLDAWPTVRRAAPEAELWVVGEGDDRERLEARAAALGIAAAVRFFGRVGEAELAALYRRASVFAMPSRQEGFGLAYAEALWCGLPCLGSSTDAAGCVIDDGETGVLVPYGDADATAAALCGLLGNPERLREMGARAERRARERFTFGRFRSDLLRGLELA